MGDCLPTASRRTPLTTIAYDGERLVSDSRQVGLWKHGLKSIKIHRVGDRLFGVAGDVVECERYIAWVKAGEPQDNKPEFDVDDDSFGVMIVQDGRCYELDERLIRYEVGVPYAMGTGSKFAMGAMYAGADAKEAVQIASRLDPNTDSVLQVIECTAP